MMRIEHRGYIISFNSDNMSLGQKQEARDTITEAIDLIEDNEGVYIETPTKPEVKDVKSDSIRYGLAEYQLF